MAKKPKKVKPAKIEKPMDDVPLLTVKEVAERLGVTYLTAWKYVREGVFPNAFLLPGGHYRIPEADVNEIMKRQRSQD